MNVKKGAFVREYRESDKNSILNLCGEVFGYGCAQNMKKLMDWEIHKRPFFELQPLLYVLEKDGEVIGNAWCFPVAFQTEHGIFHAYHFSSFMVSAQFRFYGLLLMKKILEFPYFFYITNPTEQARKVYTGLGFSCWPYYSVSLSACWKGKITDAVQKRIRFENNVIKKITHGVGFVADLFLNSLRDRFFLKNTKWKCREIDKFEKGMESVYENENLKKYFPNGMASRGKKFLKWRFIDNPKSSFRILALYDSENKFRGYGALKFVPHGKLNVCVMQDWVAPVEKSVFRFLIKQAIKIARQENADSLFLHNVPLPYREFLPEWGVKVDRRALFFYKNQNPELPENFMNSEEGVFFTEIEGDHY